MSSAGRCRGGARDSRRATTCPHQLSKWHGASLGALAIIVVVVACGLPTLHARLPSGLADDDSAASPRLLVFSGPTPLAAVQTICEATMVQGDARADHAPLVTRCLKALRGKRPICDHVYTRVLHGIAGRFTDAHVSALKQCLGDSLLHVEEDGRVHKAEGPPDHDGSDDLHLHDHASPAIHGTRPSSRHSRSLQTIPSYQKASDLGSTDSDAKQGTLSATRAPPRANADGNVRSIEVERVSWLDSVVGQLSQELLSGGALPLHETASDSSVRHETQPTENSASQAQQLQQLASSGSRYATGRNASVREYARQAQDNAPLHSDPSTSSTVPAAPPDLADTPPGRSNPVAADGLAQLAAMMDRPVIKAERLPPALWGLDRIDQRELPLDRTYMYGSSAAPGTGAGVTIYALDSGVRRSHQEFRDLGDTSAPGSGGASRASYGWDFVDDRAEAEDCDGHGTHVAATAIGRSVGVAKGARLVAVRILDCQGSGSISDTVAGLDWVSEHVSGPAIVIMSLGVAEGTWSKVLESATASLIADKRVSVFVASGNSAVDACGISPARLPEVVTVAASNLDNKFALNPGQGLPNPSQGSVQQRQRETMYRWSNTGSCVDLFAPGVEIWSACGGASRCPALTDDAYTWASGTSMACPHVAGTAAIYLSVHPTASPSEVKAALQDSATVGKIQDSRMLGGTPNRLLYSRAASEPQVVAAGEAATTPAPATPPTPPAQG